jgi:hypothetical protein
MYNSHRIGPFLPLTLEMGSWLWLRKNPMHLFAPRPVPPKAIPPLAAHLPAALSAVRLPASEPALSFSLDSSDRSAKTTTSSKSNGDLVCLNKRQRILFCCAA